VERKQVTNNALHIRLRYLRNAEAVLALALPGALAWHWLQSGAAIDWALRLPPAVLVGLMLLQGAGYWHLKLDLENYHWELMMRKRSPTHPGAILREDVLPQLTGMSVSAFARLLGVSRQTLHAVLAERSGITAEMALRLGTLLGNGPQLWVDMQTKYDLWRAEEKLHEELSHMQRLDQPVAA